MMACLGRAGPRPARRRAASTGITNVTDVVAVDGSNHAGVVFDAADLDGLNAMLASMPPEVAAQAEAYGVIQPMTVYLEA